MMRHYHNLDIYNTYYCSILCTIFLVNDAYVYVDIIFLLVNYLINDSLANILHCFFETKYYKRGKNVLDELFVLKARFLWILSQLHITLNTRTWRIDRRNGRKEASDWFDSFTSLYMPASCSLTLIIEPNIVS